jgi:hypothetical protein
VKTFVLILFVATLPCAAQSTAKYSAKVQLSISCEDDSLKNQFNSFLSRELRSLGDITIVDAKPAILVNLIVVKLSTIKGQSSGFSVAILIMSPQRADFLDLIKDKLDKDWIKMIELSTEGTSYVLDFKLRPEARTM